MLNARLIQKPLHHWVWAFACLLGVAICARANELDDARRKYRATGDYASLQILARQLKKGMSLAQTQALLGPPGHSPTDGEYMYGSDRKEFVAEDGVDMYVYLVLWFKDPNDHVTNELQDWGFTPLGE